MKGLMVIVFLFGLFSGLLADTKADEIMNKAIQAKGGEEAFSKLKKVTSEAKGKIFRGEESFDFTMTMKAILPSKFYSVMTAQGSKVEVAVNGVKAKIKLNGNALSLTPAMELDALAGVVRSDYFIFTNMSSADLLKTYSAETTWQNRKAHKIDLEYHGIKFSIYIDAEDYKVLGKSFERNNMKFEEDYTEYKTVGGVSLPSKTVTRLNGTNYMEAVADKIEATEEVDESIFE
jgi:hypothetical protein